MKVCKVLGCGCKGCSEVNKGTFSLKRRELDDLFKLSNIVFELEKELVACCGNDLDGWDLRKLFLFADDGKLDKDEAGELKLFENSFLPKRVLDDPYTS